MPLILFALVATHDDGTDFLWTTPSVLRQPHEHAREDKCFDETIKEAA